MNQIDDSRDTAVVMLADLIYRVGAELVVGRRQEDLEQFEATVCKWLAATTVEGCAPGVAEVGVAHARTHIRSALDRILAQT